MEADLEPSRGEPIDPAGAERSTRLASVRAKLLGHCAPALGRHALDVLCDFVNGMRDATDRRREVELRQRAQAGGTRSSLIDDRLKVVPPEGLGSVQRGAAQEEGRREVCAPQDRSDDLDVRAALAHAHHILGPGGVLLATAPEVSPILDDDRLTDHWRFTPRVVR